MAERWSGENVRVWRARIGATLPQPCTRCGGVVSAEMAWDVDHIRSRAEGGGHTSDNLGASHAFCNRSAGGKQSARMQAQKKTGTDRRLPNW